MIENDVIQLLKKRKAEGYVSCSESDGYKIGLVVQGGGMRGVMNSAMLDALQRMGYSNCIDNVYGNSAGATNAAYFLAGQSHIATSVYIEDLSNRKFINPFINRRIANAIKFL